MGNRVHEYRPGMVISPGTLHCPAPFDSGRGHETLPVKPWALNRITPEGVRRGAETRRKKTVPSMPRMPWDE